jgi:hypothetical protein
MDELMKEVSQILNDTAKTVDQEMIDETKFHISTIEKAIWDDRGACGTYELYALDMAATTEAEVDAIRESHKENAVVVDATRQAGKANACLEMTLLVTAEQCGMPDIAMLLGNKDAAIYYNKPDNRVGFVFRTEAWGSNEAMETGKAPSECDDRYDLTVTGMITPSAMATAVRRHDTNEVLLGEVIPLSEYKHGEHGRVLDALFLHFTVPNTMKRVSPDLYEAAYQDVLERQETLREQDGK